MPEELTFKSKVEADAMIVMDPDGNNPRVVIREQTLNIDPDMLDMPKKWCATEDRYCFDLNGVPVETTCGAVRKILEGKRSTTHG